MLSGNKMASFLIPCRQLVVKHREKILERSEILGRKEVFFISLFHVYFIDYCPIK